MISICLACLYQELYEIYERCSENRAGKVFTCLVFSSLVAHRSLLERLPYNPSAAVRPDPVSDAAGPSPVGPRDLHGERPALRGRRRAGALRAGVDVQAVQLRAHAGQLRARRRARAGKPRVGFVQSTKVLHSQ